jgi:hypothetical protein
MSAVHSRSPLQRGWTELEFAITIEIGIFKGNFRWVIPAARRDFGNAAEDTEAAMEGNDSNRNVIGVLMVARECAGMAASRGSPAAGS